MVQGFWFCCSFRVLPPKSESTFFEDESPTVTIRALLALPTKKKRRPASRSPQLRNNFEVMGKKGKSTAYGDSHHKWETTKWQATLSSSLQSARAAAYDQEGIARVKQQALDEARQRRNYAHLRGLIETRLSDDVRAQTKGSPWVASLTSAVATKEDEKGRRKMELAGLHGAAALLEAQLSDFHINGGSVDSSRHSVLLTLCPPFPRWSARHRPLAGPLLPGHHRKALSPLQSRRPPRCFPCL